MRVQNLSFAVEERRRRLRDNVAGLVPDMQSRALALDQNGKFPSEDLDLLRRRGALAAPVPVALGGLGLGTEPNGSLALMQLLRLLGRGSLSVGRLYEAHVNTLRLVVRYGTTAQTRHAAAGALAGQLFGLWVTDVPGTPLMLDADYRLSGAKAPCSGAGHLRHALVTAHTESGEQRMLLIEVPSNAHADLSGWETHGMRSTATGRIPLDGIQVTPEALIGKAGDYLRQPDFSAGAWRTSAVTLGGLEALVAEMRRRLIARGRDGDPHQRMRVGEVLIAQETARLWVQWAAEIGEANEGDAGYVANLVNLARIAVECACLDTIRNVQRALGLAAFRRGELVELLFRDLSMYLRQPAPDETLTEAAGYFMAREITNL